MIYLRIRAGRLKPVKHLVAHPRRSIPRALVAGFGTLNYGCEDQETVPPHVAIAAGWRRSHPSHKWRVSAETTRCSKCDYLLHDGAVRLDFMTSDLDGAEEML